MNYNTYNKNKYDDKYLILIIIYAINIYNLIYIIYG